MVRNCAPLLIYTLLQSVLIGSIRQNIEIIQAAQLGADDHGVVQVVNVTDAEEEGWKANTLSQGQFTFKAGTLNALTKRLATASLAGFATQNGKWRDLKNNGWLTEALIGAKTAGIKIIAVQESCHDDLKEHTGYDCTSIAWKTDSKEELNLCFDTDIFRYDPAAQGKSISDGCGVFNQRLTICKFEINTGDGSDGSWHPITVVAGHANPNMATMYHDNPTMIDGMSPDLILIDANQKGKRPHGNKAKQNKYASDALTLDKFDIAPSGEGVHTTFKTQFVYRKLYQVFESTCKDFGPDKCKGEDDRAFWALQDVKPLTCAVLRKGETPCGNFTKERKNKPSKGREDCKFAHRFCGPKTGKLGVEVFPFLEKQNMGQDEFPLEDLNLRLQDAAQMREAFDGLQPSEVFVTHKAQEDIIAGRKESVTIDHKTLSVYPPLTDAPEGPKFHEYGEKYGYPNIHWPSDHFRIAVDVTFKF